jgi:hypothetical protein
MQMLALQKLAAIPICMAPGGVTLAFNGTAYTCVCAAGYSGPSCVASG